MTKYVKFYHCINGEMHTEYGEDDINMDPILNDGTLYFEDEGEPPTYSRFEADSTVNGIRDCLTELRRAILAGEYEEIQKIAEEIGNEAMYMAEMAEAALNGDIEGER